MVKRTRRLQPATRQAPKLCSTCLVWLAPPRICCAHKLQVEARNPDNSIPVHNSLHPIRQDSVFSNPQLVPAAGGARQRTLTGNGGVCAPYPPPPPGGGQWGGAHARLGRRAGTHRAEGRPRRGHGRAERTGRVLNRHADLVSLLPPTMPWRHKGAKGRDSGQFFRKMWYSSDPKPTPRLWYGWL